MTCEWPLPQCEDPVTVRITYVNDRSRSKALCGAHFRDVEGILWARGLTWTIEPLGTALRVLEMQRQATAEDLRNRGAS